MGHGARHVARLAAAVAALQLASAVPSSALDATQRSLLFVSKLSATEPVVAGRNFTIDYAVYNGGQAAAGDVRIVDSYGVDFEVVDGPTEQTYASIAPGASETYHVTLVPRRAGLFDLVGAVVDYTCPTSDRSARGCLFPSARLSV